jgi:hypothetical protein
MLVQIHRRNLFLDPQIRDVLEAHLWEHEPGLIMEGKSVWLDEYRSSAGEDLFRTLIDCDPSIVLEIDNDDGEYAGTLVHHPDLGVYEAPTLDGEPVIGRDELNSAVSKEADLLGWIDRRLGNAWYKAIAAIPQDDPNRLTKENS